MKEKGSLQCLAVTVIFILCGLLHILLYGVPFTQGIMQILYGILVLLWSLSIQKRIIEPTIRRILLGIGGLLVFHQLLQAARYALFTEAILWLRYLWYLYYVPMVLIPLFLLWIALFVHQDHPEKLRGLLTGLGLAAGILILLFLTNDLHHLAFPVGQGEMTGFGRQEHAIVYYIYVVWDVLCFSAAILILIRKSRLAGLFSRLYLPLLPCFLGAGKLLLDALGIGMRLRGADLWNIAELFGYITLGFLEGCIQIGLIQANTYYEKFFRITREPAAIFDHQGRIQYMTAGWEKLESGKRPNLEYVSQKIAGGRAEWAMDVSAIQALHEEISLSTEQIQSRNEYLKAENASAESRTAIQTRNRLYDHVVQIIKPQTQKIQKWIGKEEVIRNQEELARIAVLTAYIKRRAHIELLKEDTHSISTKELFTALSESAEYIRLCGIDIEVMTRGEGKIGAEETAQIYEAFEEVMEAALDSLTSMVVIMNAGPGQDLDLRILMNAEKQQIPLTELKKKRSKQGIQIAVSGEEKDVVVQIRTGKGAER